MKVVRRSDEPDLRQEERRRRSGSGLIVGSDAFTAKSFTINSMFQRRLSRVGRQSPCGLQRGASGPDGLHVRRCREGK